MDEFFVHFGLYNGNDLPDLEDLDYGVFSEGSVAVFVLETDSIDEIIKNYQELYNQTQFFRKSFLSDVEVIDLKTENFGLVKDYEYIRGPIDYAIFKVGFSVFKYSDGFVEPVNFGGVDDLRELAKAISP